MAAYLGVNVGDTLSFLGVMAFVDAVVAVEVLALEVAEVRSHGGL